MAVLKLLVIIGYVYVHTFIGLWYFALSAVSFNQLRVERSLRI